jgi:8-oxo-dGTP pyrophosphatase MutT (NUDIX family)
MIMVMSAGELVALFDPSGSVVGAATRGRVRREGLWHGGTAVLLRSLDGTSVYLHQRTFDKDIYPGRFDCWAGGVLATGETPEAGAARELAEELGITGVPLRPLFTFPFVDCPVRYHCFCYETRSDGPVTIQPEEILAGEWVAMPELRARLADQRYRFAPDARMAIERWFAEQRDRG